MKIIFIMESVLITLISILCCILILKLLFRLRSTLPWRVNCWFCNNYFWLKFPERNCFICPKCEQYNGFTKDGDYNKPIFASNDQAFKTPKVFHSSPPRNGLCKMCNINQQLKVVQLANFVPMNDKNFDEEIESYKMQLEKAYKLCSPCRKVLQAKLHKEKETLLGTKLLETRTPEKTNQSKETPNPKLKSFINSTSTFVAGILLVLVSIECYKNVMRNKNLSSTITNLNEIITSLSERIASIVKMKTLMTFPSLENYLKDIDNVLYLDVSKHFQFSMKSLDHVNVLTQKALGGFVCLVQIIGHIWNVNKLKYTILIDLLWSVFVMTSIAHQSVAIEPTIMSLIKLLSILTVMLVYKSMKTKASGKMPMLPKRMKNLNKTMLSTKLSDDDTMMDTDDDVSLCKFGLHNFSDSSNETVNPLNSLINGRSFTPRYDGMWTKPKLNASSNETTNPLNISLNNGRPFTPRCDGIWTKPKLNSTFCVNPVLKSPSSVSDTVFIKPSFDKYQNLAKSDSDSDLDESISSLCISSPKKGKEKGKSIFSLRKFTATPSFIAPTPLNRSRPLISPSKLGHSTSWVAGGYWGSEGERQIFSVNGSRSSSQSSGFESQASSANQRNVFSQPSSREESVCGEDKPMFDRFQNCNVNHYGNFQTQNFSRVTSPVFPQMQYNGHVHIPQARFAQQNAGQNVFTQRQQYAHSDMFKAPVGSGLIKLPQVNSFASH